MEMKLSKQIQWILTEGKHAGSHKFALLRAILDYIVEKNPNQDEDLKIPLIYLAEKFITYYWIMYLNNVKQIMTTNRFLYYEYLDTIIQELNVPGLVTGSLAEKHIHTLWEALRNEKKFPRKIVTALNKTRINTFNGPVRHTLYVSIREEPTNLDFYKFRDGPPGPVKGGTYREFYENEITFVTLKKDYIGEFKEMYFWFEQAIITNWARFTDQFPDNRKKSNHTGLTLLEIPEPTRGDLNHFRKHFRDLDVVKCVYCDDRPFDAIDHIIPWKMVKNDEFWNMLPICRSCNSSKSDRIWILNEQAKKILKDSITNIIDRLDDYPDFRNQILTYFFHIRQTPPLEDGKVLCNTLYEMTINRIADFVSENKGDLK